MDLDIAGDLVHCYMISSKLNQVLGRSLYQSTVHTPFTRTPCGSSVQAFTMNYKLYSEPSVLQRLVADKQWSDCFPYMEKNKICQTGTVS